MVAAVVRFDMDTNSLIKQTIDCCYIVHRELGHGFNEKIYERALKIVLKELGLPAKAQVPIDFHFHGQIIGEYFADLVIKNELIVELKAVAATDSSRKSQVINYLKATRKPMCLLVNFGAPKLEISRLYNNGLKARPD